MTQVEAPRMALEVGQRIGAALGHPVEVHLERDQRRVSLPKQQVVRQDTTRSGARATSAFIRSRTV
jgi:hypothetical protein